MIVRAEDGKKRVSLGDSVLTLKQQIEEKEGIVTDDQGLSYEGVRLQNDYVLGSYGIDKNFAG
jgi:hypothetical protein